MFLGVLVVGLAVGWAVQSGNNGSDIALEGEAAPDFTVELIDGGTYTLSQSEGRQVVLNFWASWCGPCREEIPAISIFAEAHPDIDVIGIAVRDPEQASRDFAAEVEASYPLALTDDAVENLYPGLGLPYTYVIDADGVVSTIWNGIVDQFVLNDLVASS